jgi:hypothetical protein
MTNQNSKKSDGATSRPKDQEAQDSQPDYSTTLKDIELNLLRELLKDGVGSGEDSNKAPSQILQEINHRYRRYLLTFVAVASLAIGILSFIGYNKLEALKEGELETRRAISAIEERISAIEERISAIEERISAIEDEKRLLGNASLMGHLVQESSCFVPEVNPGGIKRVKGYVL